MQSKHFDDGASLAFENAMRLYNSAILLSEKKIYSVANSLLILSAEEASKAFAIKVQGLNPEKLDDTFKKSFEDHKTKIDIIRGIVFVSTLFRKMFQFEMEPLIADAQKEPDFDKRIELISHYRKKGFDDLVNWLKTEKASKNDMSAELKWWKHAKVLKESGFYLEVNNNKWQSPFKITKATFNRSLKFVQSYLNYVEKAVDTDFNSEELQKFKDDFYEQFPIPPEI